MQKCGEIMKQLFMILLVLCFLCSTGCVSKNQSDAASVYAKDQQEQANTSQSEILTEGSDDTTTKQSVSTEAYSPQTDDEIKRDKEESQRSVSDTTAKIDASDSESISITEKPKEESKKENTADHFTSSANSESVIPKTSVVDAKAVAVKTVEYINAYRAEQGVSAAVVLPGLTKYAEYRSRQLVTNFEHSTFDERAAATALKYGEYVDPVLFGLEGESYYTANAREAIGKGSLFGTIEQTAERIASGFKNSQGHWSYVGSEEYKYIAVGVTCENGFWYCDIAVSTVNTDN